MSAADNCIKLKGNVHHLDSDTFLFDHDFIHDSGAEVSVIPIELVRKHGLWVYPTEKRVEVANGTDANCQGLVELFSQGRTEHVSVKFFSSWWS